MKQGIFTLRKLSQIWGENKQSLNTQLPQLPTGAYSPSYPTRTEYRTGGSTLNDAIDRTEVSWTNIVSTNQDTGENEISRLTTQQIPINIWGDLLINGRKAIKEYDTCESPYFNSVVLNDVNTGTVHPRIDLKEGEIAFTDDGDTDIFVNIGNNEIVRFIRSDSKVSYDNVSDVVVREINYIQATAPTSDPNLFDGCLWYDNTNNLLYKYDLATTTFKKVYYLKEDDYNDYYPISDEPGMGEPQYNVIYVYAPFSGSVKVPTDILYYNGTQLVSFGNGGAGGGITFVQCTTAASTAQKDVTIVSAATDWSDLYYSCFAIQFTQGQTATTPTLSINNFSPIPFRTEAYPAQACKVNPGQNGIAEVMIIPYAGGSVAAVRSITSVTYNWNEKNSFLTFNDGINGQVRAFNTSDKLQFTAGGSGNSAKTQIDITSYDNSGTYQGLAVVKINCANGIIDAKTTQADIESVSTYGGFNFGGVTISSGIESDYIIRTKGELEIDAAGTATQIKCNGSSLFTQLDVGECQYKYNKSAGVKRVTIFFTFDPVDLSKVIYTIPAGYALLNAQIGAGASTNFTMGLAYYNSSAVTGPLIDIEYTAYDGTPVSISAQPMSGCFSSMNAISNAKSPGEGNIVITSADVNAGPVTIYGEYLLIPDAGI